MGGGNMNAPKGIDETYLVFPGAAMIIAL